MPITVWRHSLPFTVSTEQQTIFTGSRCLFTSIDAKMEQSAQQGATPTHTGARKNATNIISMGLVHVTLSYQGAQTKHFPTLLFAINPPLRA